MSEMIKEKSKDPNVPKKFDKEFIELCKRHNVPAAYVAVIPTRGDDDLRLSVTTGGSKGACDWVEQAIRAATSAGAL